MKMTRALKALCDAENRAVKSWLMAYILYDRALAMNLSDDIIGRLRQIETSRKLRDIDATAAREAYERQMTGS